VRVFISHSSRNNNEAAAVKKWLIENEPSLENEIFLDFTDTGIEAGQRWKEALRQASNRCEAVICLLSPHWENSAHCKAEYLYAEDLRKTIVAARLEPSDNSSITSEWQRCDLFANGSEVETVTLDSGHSVQFSKDGLQRLLVGLRALGMGTDYFPWPPEHDPDRPPYRGWAALDRHDAAVFFGRDAQIVRGLDALRGMRVAGVETMLVIQGPSGAGKSAFLRAGLLPRLYKDDRRFLPLEVIRPERAVLTGDHGLANAICEVRKRVGLDGPELGDIRRACTPDKAEQLQAWLEEARQAAKARLIAPDPQQAAPTLVLPLDQGEELFQITSTSEADPFLSIVADLLRCRDGVAPTLLLVVTIRADSYEPLHSAPQLAGVGSRSFNDLKEMPPGQFKEVIEGPAKRATDAGLPLTIEPALTEQLMKDAPTADGLPLLALTLERLCAEYGGDGDLTLDEYTRMGGLKRIVQTEVDKILGDDQELRKARLDILREAFVPSLASINLDSSRPGRRIARLKDLPPESHELIDAFVEKRLLVRKKLRGEVYIEVALESLLRQWKELAGWLRIESQDLKFAERIRLLAKDWRDRGSLDSDLALRGTRLLEAEKLAAKGHYFTGWNDPANDYLKACRRRENELVEEEQQRHAKELDAAERHAAQMGRSRMRFVIATAVAVVVALAAIAGGWLAVDLKGKQDKQFHEATAMRLVFEAGDMLTGARNEGDFRALQQLLAAPHVAPPGDSAWLFEAVVARRDMRKLIQTNAKVTSVAASTNGDRFATGSVDGTVRVWNTTTGQPEGAAFKTDHGSVWSVAFAGEKIVIGSNDDTIQIWDPAAGESTLLGAPTANTPVRSLAVSSDGKHIVSGSTDGTVRVWDAEEELQVGDDIGTGASELMSVAVSGQTVATGSEDGTVQQWDLKGSRIGLPMNAGTGAVWSVAFSPLGDLIAAAGAGDNVLLWHAADGARPPTRIPHSDGVWTVAFSPSGDRIVTGGTDDAVRLWDVQGDNIIGARLLGHGGDVKGVTFAGDGLVSVSDDRTVRIWNTPELHPAVRSGPSSDLKVVSLAFPGEQIVSATANGTVQAWDRSGKPTERSFAVESGARSSPVFSSDGSALASATSKGTVRIWSAIDGRPRSPAIAASPGDIAALVFRGERIAARGSDDDALRQWDLTEGTLEGEPIPLGDNAVSALAFSSDGRSLVVAEDGGAVSVRDVASGAPITSTPMNGDDDANLDERKVTSVAFSRDGRYLVTGAGGDDSVRVWNAQTGKLIGEPIAGHQRNVTSVAFSPDGRYIASGAEDTTVRVWDATTQRPVGPPLTVFRGVTTVAFSPDGHHIVAGLTDGTIRIWPGPEMWSAELCAKLTRTMNRQQWANWVAEEIDYEPVCEGLEAQPDNNGS
jgi:WD40 repeat protein